MAYVPDAIAALRGLPRRIKVDNGHEFISRALDARAYFNGVKIDYSRPGTPADNAHRESFNESLLDDCLNVHMYTGLYQQPIIADRYQQPLF